MKKIPFLPVFLLLTQCSFAQTLETVTANGNTTSKGLEAAMLGAVSDPYGYISVTMPADANSYSYYGLTRQGNIGMGIGINTSNQFFIGPTYGGTTHTLGNSWLAMNTANAQFSGSVTATQFNGSGAGLTGIASGLSIGGSASTVTTTFSGANTSMPIVLNSGGADYYAGPTINPSTNAISATKFITSGGVSSQFVKGDGSLDGVAYLPLTAGFSSPLAGTVQIGTTAFGGDYLFLYNINDHQIVLNSQGTDYGIIGSNSDIWYLGHSNIETSNIPVLSWNKSGNVGIGTSNPQSTLSVNGTITGKQMTVTQAGWSDFVFDKDYRLKPLSAVATYIVQNNHLRDIPSAKEIETKGLDLGDMQKKQIQKIEELTLYAIEQDKQIKSQQQQLANLNQLVTTQEQTIEQLKKMICNQQERLTSIEKEMNN